MQKRIREKVRFDLKRESSLLRLNEGKLEHLESWLEECREAIDAKQEVRNPIYLITKLTFFACIFLTFLFTVIKPELIVIGGIIAFLGCKLLAPIYKNAQTKKWLKKNNWETIPLEEVEEMRHEYEKLISDLYHTIDSREAKIRVIQEALKEDGKTLMVQNPNKVDIDEGLASEFDEYLEAYQDLPVDEFHYQDFKEKEQIPKVKKLHI